MHTKGEDMHCATTGARGRGPPLGATVDPAVLAPPPADGTRLRAVGFVSRDRASGLVVELANDRARARRADLLSLHPPLTLGGLIERLTDRAQGTRERANHRHRCRVAQVPHLALGLVEHPIRAPLHAFPAASAVSERGLLRAQASQLLVAVLDGGLGLGLGLAPADAHHLLAIRGCNAGIDPQVHPDAGLLGARLVGDLADEPHHAIGAPHLPEPARQGDGARQRETPGATLAMRQEEPPVPNARILVGVHPIMSARLPPRIAGLGLAMLAQLAAGVHRLAELPDTLLRALGGARAIAALGPSLPAHARRPAPAQAPRAMRAHHQITPQPRRLVAARREGRPFGCCVRQPRHFYRSLAHGDGRAQMFHLRNGSVRRRPCGRPGFHPHA